MIRHTKGRFRARLPRRLPLLGGKEKPSIRSEDTGDREEGRIGLHVADGVAIITIRRPAKMNALNKKMWVDLLETVRLASRDAGVRVLVLRGEGHHFSSGSDLGEFGRVSLSKAEDIFWRMEECVAAIEGSRVPPLACIRGYALGTGLELALACDLRVADSRATLGMPIARLGITLSEPFAKRLLALIGPAKMKDLVYTGRLLDASEASRWGLLDRIVEDQPALRETLTLASVIRDQSSASIKAAKRWAGSGSGEMPETYTYIDAEDFPEGVAAFQEGRSPRFYQKDIYHKDTNSSG
jgi:enoyl-CoA hydratase